MGLVRGLVFARMLRSIEIWLYTRGGRAGVLGGISGPDVPKL